MKLRTFLGWSSALCLSLSSAQAQETGEVEQIRKQLQQANETFQKAVEQHRQLIEALNKRLESIQPTQGRGAIAPPDQKPPAAPVAAIVPEPKPWSPSQPILLAKAGSAYMNISFDALVDGGWSTARDPGSQLNLGDHDPNQRGFTLPNAEIALDGAVDPYFKGFANIVLKLDQQNDTSVELEEAFLQSSSLPDNLQLKAGQFFAAFGRQNPQHPHQWAFVDAPLILTRAFGPDGLRNVGAQMSWLVPLPFFTELSLGVFNGEGETAFSFRNQGDDGLVHGRATLDRTLRGPGDLLYTPRLSTSFELTDHQTLVAGVSGAFGPNDTDAHATTQIYGVDLYWKWKPSRAHEGFPFVSWQTEALYQRFEAGADATATPALPREVLRDYGFYSQVLWGFKPRWVAGLRGEWVDGNHGADDANDVFRGQRTRVSPAMTWFLSEFSKVRLQYDYDHGKEFGDDHSVWLQVEFLLGAHGAHKF